MLLVACIFPVFCGIGLLIHKKNTNRKVLWGTALTEVLFTAGLFAVAAYESLGKTCQLFSLSGQLEIVLKLDLAGLLFAVLALIVFGCAFVFSFEYMSHEKKESRYLGFLMIALGVYLFLCSAGNLVTFYFFFEMLTVTTFPLVLHNEAHTSVLAGLKYLLYSLCGAYAALFGIYFVSRFAGSLMFGQKGMISMEAFELNSKLLLAVALVMTLGFGVKAGMFPMHAWLTSAHPAAPAPASAVLSAVIVKAGVLGIFRVVYDVFGWAVLRGTWVQTVLLSMSILTVFMGSMLAYGEPVLKKRLAYSTISQVSYILFGLFLMNETAAAGGFLHVLAHGFVKAVLFLCAGAVIFRTGKTRVEELRGIGKEMPFTMCCYTVAALGLIGIPPMGGFVSKWYLCMGALSSDAQPFARIGVVVLLISALLTAGYLLPVSVNGFLPGADYDYHTCEKKEPSAWMTIPILILTVLSLIIGLFPGGMIQWFSGILA